MKRFRWAVLLTMLLILSPIVPAGTVVVHSGLSAHNTIIEQAYSALGHTVRALHEEIIPLSFDFFSQESSASG